MKKFISTSAIVLFSLLAAAGAQRKIAVASYPWNGSTVSQMISDLKKIGVSEVFMFGNLKMGEGEFPASVFNYNMAPEQMKAAKKVFDENKIRIVGFGHLHCKTEAEIKTAFEFAKFFGMDFLSVESPKDTLPFYVKYSEKFGIKTGLYTHPIESKGAPYNTPERLCSALSENAGVCAFPDSGHIWCSGFDVAEILKKLDGKICAMSLNERAADKNCAPFGKGVIPLDAILSELDRQGFNGWIVVMQATKGAPLDIVAPSVEFLRARPAK